MSNVSSLDRIVDIANVVVLIALALSFVGGGASILYSRRLNKAKDTQLALDLKDKDLQIAQARSDAERQIAESKQRIETEAQEREAKIKADADVKIAEAHAIAAQANDAAGKANERAAGLEQQNLTLRSGVANLEKEAADAKQRYLALLERVSPRSISPEQRKRVLSLLSTFDKGSVSITCLNGNAESCGFALEIAELLRAAGWGVEGPTDMVLFGPSGQTPKGLFLIIKDASNVPPLANVLLTVLNTSGIPATGEQNPNLDAGKINILVGSKP